MVGVEPVETIHWFPDDLVERQYEDAYGVKTVNYGVIGMVEREPGKVFLWVYVPGHKEPKQWPATECRLLRRVNKNKEGNHG